MGLFYRASQRELLDIRNKIFIDFGVPALKQQGFDKSPFSTAWFGKNADIGYLYELCRLTNGNCLEMISVRIVKGDLAIQIFLNIFEIQPSLESLTQLAGIDGLKFHVPPNSISAMRLKSDDIKGPPILSYNYMFKGHKIKTYYTKIGLKKRASELALIIEADLVNIDYYVKRWHEIHNPMLTSWNGDPIV